jgi:hypothetical protein
MSAQLALLKPVSVRQPEWLHEGMQCGACDTGHLHLRHPSEACGCKQTHCICLAEGYAVCDTCGHLRQVWPREMATRFELVPAELD